MVLTLDKLGILASCWSEVVYNNVSCEALLVDEGHTAFKVYQAKLSQFGQEIDNVTHKLLYREKFRESAARAPVLQFRRHDLTVQPYCSRVVSEARCLLAQRAGFPNVEEWTSRMRPKPIDMEPDPIRRAMAAKLRPPGAGREIVDEYVESLRLETRMAIEEEASKFLRGPVGCFIPGRRSDILVECCRRYLSPLGFVQRRIALKNYVAFESEVADGVALRWVIGDKEQEFFNPLPAACIPMLLLVNRDFKKRTLVAQKSDLFLEINFQDIVEGVRITYQDCFTEAEMEVIVKVHALILKWSLPSLRASITEALLG